MDISPKAEPVGWAAIVSAIVAAAVSYGLPITDELTALLVLVAPIIGGLIARRFVWAQPSHVRATQAAYQQGANDATDRAADARVRMAGREG